MIDRLLHLVERERRKAEKKAKFDQKAAKVANAESAPAIPSKNKEKKAKAEKKAEEEVLPEYVENTPSGQKKSALREFGLPN